MNIEIEYIDQNSILSSRSEDISNFAILKHLAIAGQWYLPALKYYTRIIGIFLHYVEYLDRTTLNSSKFSLPPTIRRDPTETGQFSNLVGKGIGDFLSKRLSGAKVTHNYEAAMILQGIPLSGSRPDLYCIGEAFQFAVEAKGFSAANVSAREMLRHKNQANSGPLPVNFCVASVSYNLYTQVKCNYHDPFDRNVELNVTINRELNSVHPETPMP
jgi:hypothetical protein